MKKARALKPLKLPSQQRSKATVQAILQATTYILLRAGYGGLNTNAIAERAGVNIATLYQYFPNKEAIFAELARRHVEETRAAAVASLAGRRERGLEATLRGTIEATIAARAVQPELHRIFTEESPRLGIGPIDAPADEALRREQKAWIAEVADTHPEPELAMWITQNVVHLLVHRAIVERPKDLARPAFAGELTALVTRYLQPRAKKKRKKRNATPRGLGPRRDGRQR